MCRPNPRARPAIARNDGKKCRKSRGAQCRMRPAATRRASLRRASASDSCPWGAPSAASVCLGNLHAVASSSVARRKSRRAALAKLLSRAASRRSSADAHDPSKARVSMARALQCASCHWRNISWDFKVHLELVHTDDSAVRARRRPRPSLGTLSIDMSSLPRRCDPIRLP